MMTKNARRLTLIAQQEVTIYQHSTPLLRIQNGQKQLTPFLPI